MSTLRDIEPLESIQTEETLYRGTFRARKQSGVWYLLVGKEIGNILGLQSGDLVETKLIRIMRRPHGERKQD